MFTVTANSSPENLGIPLRQGCLLPKPTLLFHHRLSFLSCLSFAKLRLLCPDHSSGSPPLPSLRCEGSRVASGPVGPALTPASLPAVRVVTCLPGNRPLSLATTICRLLGGLPPRALPAQASHTTLQGAVVPPPGPGARGCSHSGLCEEDLGARAVSPLPEHPCPTAQPGYTLHGHPKGLPGGAEPGGRPRPLPRPRAVRWGL